MSSAAWSTKSVKATPIAADELLIIDSADANPATQNKRITIGTIPTTAEANTSSNSGVGNGWAQTKVGVDLPFKSLITTSPISTTVNADDLTLTLDSTVVQSTLPTTYTAGARQDFLGSTGANAGLNIGALAGNPFTQVNGDIWLNTSTQQIFGRINGANVDLSSVGEFLGPWTANHDAGTFDLNNIGALNFDTTDVQIDNLAGTLILNVPSGSSEEIKFQFGFVDTYTFSEIEADFDGKNLVGVNDLTLNGTVSFPDGVRQTFNPSNTVTGLNVGANATDPTIPVDGDIYYQTGVGFRGRDAGSWFTFDITAEFLGPWTADHDAGGFDLINVGGITINNPADNFQYIITPSAIIADRILTIPLLIADDTFVTEGFIQTLTNKTLTAPTIGDFTNSGHDHSTVINGGQFASTNLTDTAVIVRTDQINIFGDFAQTFTDDTLFIQNPAATFEYQIIADAIVADRTVTLPLLTGNDIFVTEAFAQTLANKSIDLTSNTLTGTFAQFNTAVSDETLAGLGTAQTFTLTNTFAELIETGRLQFGQGTPVASPAGGILTLGTDGNVFDITGTNTINEITPTDWQAGSVIYLQFDGILTVTNSSGGTNDILLGNGANFTTAVGDVLTLFFNGADWQEVARSTVGVGSQTPWLSDINAATFDLTNLSNIEFTTTTGAPGAGVQAIYADGNGIILNVPTGDDFDFKINDVSEYVFDSTIADFNSNSIINATMDGDLNTFVDINETQMNVSVGAAATVLTSNGVGSPPTYQVVAGTGDVVGPGSATDNAIARFDTGTGKLIQNGVILIDDLANTTLIRSLQFVSFTSPPSASVEYIAVVNNDFEINVTTGNNFKLEVNDVVEYQYDATSANFNSNNLIMASAYTQYTSIGSPGVTGSATVGRIFLDSGNSSHVSVIRNASVIDLEGGGEFLGPWTADHDAAGFDLLNVGGITISNPADTFQYIVTPAAIVADRILNLPLLTGTDTLVTEAFIQTLTNKTITAAGNTLTIASTDLTDTAVIVLENQVNTYTTGLPQIVGHDVTDAGFRIVPFASDPTTQVNGDIWINDTSNTIFARINGVDVDLGAGAAGGEANTISSLGGGTFALTAAVPKSGVNLQTISVSNGAGMNAALAADILTLAVTATVVRTDQSNTYGAFLQNFVATSMRIPLSAAPTMATDGDFAIDTTVTDFSHGIIKYFDGEELGVVSMPIVQFTTPTDGDVIAYNAINDEFQLVTAGGGGDVVGPASSTTNAITRFDDTTGKLLTNGVITIDDSANMTLIRSAQFANFNTEPADSLTWIQLNNAKFELNTTAGNAITLSSNGADVASFATTLINFNSTNIRVDSANIRFREIGDPAAPAATFAHVYIKNVGGRSHLFIRDDVGVADIQTGGDVVGPASATNHVIAVFDGTTGKIIDEAGSSGFEPIIDVAGQPTWVRYNIFTSNAVAGPGASVGWIGNQSNFMTLNGSTAVAFQVQQLVKVTISSTSVILADGINLILGAGTNNGYMQLDSISSPASTGSAAIGRFFMDADNSDHLTIQRNGVEVDLEAFVQTPWAQDIDASNNSLSNLDILEFGSVVDTPTAANAEIWWDATSMFLNVPTGDTIVASINGSTELTIALNQLTTPAGTDVDVGGDLVVGDRIQGNKGADVASATTITLVDGNLFDITGTTQIDAMTSTNWQAGSMVVLHFDAILTVTHNTGADGFFLQGAASFVTTADDTLTVIWNGTRWEEISRSVN
jgi:hypothetical protein